MSTENDTLSTLLILSSASDELNKILPPVAGLPATLINELYTIGKSTSCSFTIPCEYISRYHVTIRYDGNGQYSIMSNSKNGTLLNNSRIDGKGWLPLRQHDVIGLSCFFSFLFVTRRIALRIKPIPVFQRGALLKEFR